MLARLAAILRARRAGLLRLRPAESSMHIDCLGNACGLCCSVMGGGVVVDAITENDLIRATVATRICGRSALMKHDKGACVLLKDNVCSRYQMRPRGCREYPYYNVGGRLYYDQGCPGVRFGTDDRPRVATISAISQYFPFPVLVQQMLISLFRIW